MRRVAGNLKLGVTQNLITPHLVRCVNEPGDNKLPSPTTVIAGGSRSLTSEVFGDTLNPFDHHRFSASSITSDS